MSTSPTETMRQYFEADGSPRILESGTDGAHCAVATGSADGCDHCDTFGGIKTYANQACLPLNGRIVCIDWCIHHIVAALNVGGVRTVACCCGHGVMPGRIDLEDGRILTITKPNNSGLPRSGERGTGQSGD